MENLKYDIDHLGGKWAETYGEVKGQKELMASTKDDPCSEVIYSQHNDRYNVQPRDEREDDLGITTG